MTFNWQFLGLPLHPLVVHATVVMLPLTILLLAVCAFSARVRARVGAVLPLAGVICLLLVPAATESGQNLMERLPPSPLIQAHVAASHGLLPWAFALAGACILVWLIGLGRNPYKGKASLRGVNPFSILVAIISCTVAVGATAQISYIGHLGSKAAWASVPPPASVAAPPAAAPAPGATTPPP